MSEKPLPFVITDRRKFSTDGEPRPDADPSPKAEPRETLAAVPPAAPAGGTPLTLAGEPARDAHAQDGFAESAADADSFSDSYAAQPYSTQPYATETGMAEGDAPESEMPPPPTAEQMEQSRLAFNATAERLDIAIRSANPGGDHPPAMSFEQLIQSVYMQAILQLGGGTEQGQQPQVDLLGARQSIDMLGVLETKTAGNLSAAETNLLFSALFELRLAFLELTQAIARQAQQQQSRQNPGAGFGAGPGRPGPSIVR